MQSRHTRRLPPSGYLDIECRTRRMRRQDKAGNTVAIGVSSDRTPGEHGANSSGTTLHVVDGLRFALDASQVRAGTITFLVKNDGPMPHDFAIQGNGVDQKTAMLKPGHTASLTVDLKPGTYTYKCTMPGHALLG